MFQTPRKVWEFSRNVSPVWFEVPREGRKGGARDFYITGDFNVGLGSDVYR